MAEAKHEFGGIARVTATMLMTFMATSPLAFLTHGILGKITFFFLTKVGNWLASNGLAILNLGVDAIKIAQQKKTFDREIEKALKAVAESKGNLSPSEAKAIDAEVKAAFKRFAKFI